jgi:chemotaxis signal transduction protein
MATSDVHVRLQVGSETYAMSIENVLEVAELGVLTPVPGAASCVLGVRNFNGQVLPVFDLAQVLGTPRGGRPSRLLVADHGGRLAGLAVDGVTDVSSLTAEFESADSEYLTHAVLENGCLVGVVDIERLFASLAGEAA